MQNRIIEKINIYNLKDKWQKVEIKIELKKVFRRKNIIRLDKVILNIIKYF